LGVADSPSQLPSEAHPEPESRPAARGPAPVPESLLTSDQVLFDPQKGEFSQGLDPQSDEQQPPAKFARKKSTRSLRQPKDRKPSASGHPTEEKFFETDEELFKYYCKFKYPRYTKVKRRHCISKEAIAFYSKREPTTFGKGEQLAALKATILTI
jgi:hypothetical protein